MKQNERFGTLDSMRGLAALSVMIGHFFLVFPSLAQNTAKLGYMKSPVNMIKYSPLHIFWAGHEAVILFFLLSGFVLSLPFLNSTSSSYGIYLVKRICRIYIPYLCAVFIAIVVKQIFFNAPLQQVSSYFQSQWTAVTELKSILAHVFFLGNFNSTLYDPILWSLVHEMRISIIFPLLMIVVVRGGWKGSLLTCALLTLMAEVLLRLLDPPYMTNFVATIQYAAFFIVGALLAKYRNEIKTYYDKLSRLSKYILASAAILLYTFHWLFYTQSYHVYFQYFREDWIIALGACLFIVMALNSVAAKKALLHPVSVYLGKISYSLYLFHFVVLLSLLHLLRGYFSIYIILVMAFILSFVCATAGYYWIELPAIRLGKRMVRPRHLHGSDVSSSNNNGI
ncbi:acyltransferase [Paenibacillus anaericanus]|uniref:Acyltransferase n=1 Tax=Paenibacillus anaericanus TaxID=170367 RepID=A0A3S1K135_9BACL|nr:acyltransferase [Paenibacillus anaericanus]RUT41425.1 acyltransferase [Paenibacillus anaericanus]